MRGKVVKILREGSGNRITPAYAGKRFPTSCRCSAVQDHPRLCGEKIPEIVQHIKDKGSPPPMRGKVNFPNQPASPDRITPAYAGKRYSAAGGSGRWQDHPRLCGEKRIFPSYDSGMTGSPPPMRGKASGTFKSLFSSGITPAYAGKRGLCHYDTSRHKDHPRLCGEKTQGFQIHIADEGSPPPMRGKVDPFRHRCRQTGITPAYAGKSSLPHRTAPTIQDHPRLCGEKVFLIHIHSVQYGSPPPMRGKVNILGIFFVVWRITPAYAGKSTFQHLHTSCNRDHPRLCGEKTKKIPKQRYFFHQPASFSFSLQYT